MKLTSAVVLVGLLALGLFVVSGCQQQAEQAQTPAEETADAAAETAGEMTEEAGEVTEEAGEVTEEAGEVAEDAATKTADMAQRAAQLAAHGKALDPVCGMVVEMEGTPTVEHEGTTYYFCSDSCAAKFQKNPEQYLPGSQ